MSPETHIPLYEFEAAIERGFRSIFEAQGFTVNTPDNFDFQRPTPRVDIRAQTGPATDHRSTHDVIYRPDSFTGSLEVIITTLVAPGTDAQATEPASSLAYRHHSKQRAKVRYLMGRCETDFTLNRTTGDDSWLPLHGLNRVFPQGDEPVMQGENGALITTSRYDIHFNIRPSAWPAVD